MTEPARALETLFGLFPWFALVIFIATVIVLPLRARNPEFRRATWLHMNAQPRLNIILESVRVLIAVGLALLGIAFLGAGYAFGWGFFPLAASSAFVVAFHAWTASRPWDD